MRKTLLVLTLGLLVGMANADVMYSTNFASSEGYTVGTRIDGQKGWTGVGDSNLLIEGVLIVMPVASGGNGAYSAVEHAVDTTGKTALTLKTSMQVSATNAQATGVILLSSAGSDGPKVGLSLANGLYCSNGATTTQIISSVAGATYYDIEMAIDMVGKTYDVTVTQGSTVTTVTNQAWVNTGLTGFDKLHLGGYQATTGQQTASAFPYVELSGVPEPATMSLLAIGSVLAIRRRKR